ncbi:SDR family NAD(P)-dependent oxidoreductase [Pedococcus sp. 5OH_020]|uniref:SDR family NAD(P)-dependent oxidoreductase n=1 Tax=Pedococcus sp. 5OH_020 TaxID=2989814 RepID=UPI0022E9C0D6|nr:SDR family NAD(P)-dependent oxidoreductase [Pedococcus sp. 5OH_020]
MPLSPDATAASSNGLMEPLSDLVVVVAGAGGSAGPPLVQRLASAGATVVALDSSQERAEQVVAAAREATGSDRVEAHAVDLLDAAATADLASDVVARHGRVDGLAHLVGGWRGGVHLAEEPLEDWDLLHDLLIRTLLHTSRAFHDALKASPRGRLVLISTVQAQAPVSTNAMYGAAKAAAEAWTLAVADSFAGTDAAALILPIKALLTPEMRQAKPEAAFSGYTDVAALADTIHDLFLRPAAELNGKRIS